MPRRAKGARLYLRKRRGRETVWVILDEENEASTGCGAGDRGSAEKALASYIARGEVPQDGQLRSVINSTKPGVAEVEAGRVLAVEPLMSTQTDSILKPKSRKPSLRRRLGAGAAALEARGLRPCVVDVLPNDTIRYHLSPPAIEDDLDRELVAFEAQHDKD